MTKRIINLDILRIIAIFFVIVIHISASNFYSVPTGSYDFKIFNLFDSLSRFSVPIFVMISGSLFLDKSVSFKDLFLKYIFRLLIALIIWSFLYTLFHHFLYANYSIWGFIKAWIQGPGHLWFMFMIIGIYMVVPFLKGIVNSGGANIKYLLILFFVFQITIPFILGFKTINAFEHVLNNMNLFLPLGYAGYFMLGYYLSNNEISKTKRKLIYFLGIISTLTIIFGTYFLSLEKGKVIVILYEYLSPFVFLQSLAIFVLFKYKKFKFNSSKEKMVTTISKYTFGIYLIHMFFVTIFQRIGLSSNAINPLIMIPLSSLLVFIMSLSITFIISKIPKISKYLI